MWQSLGRTLIYRSRLSALTRTALENRLSSSPYSTLPRLTEKDVEEVRIPVPWGHIAGKWWGNKDEVPILALHGWQDNANSYDRLVPLLNVTSFLAIDLPGHGHSSYLPKGKVYNFLEYMYAIRRVVDHFKWKKYSMIAHSFGSALGFVHASLFPEELDCYIMLECGRSLIMLYTLEISKHISEGIDKIIEIEKKMDSQAPPVYKLEEAIKLIMTGSLGSINTPEAAMVLLKRGVVQSVRKTADKASERKESTSDLNPFLQFELANKEPKGPGPSGAGQGQEKLQVYEKLMKEVCQMKTMKIDAGDELSYQFTRDPRTRINQFGVLDREIIVECSKHITCPVLSVRARNGFLHHSSKEVFEETNLIIQKNCKHFEHHEVEGRHHAHLNTPETVAPSVNSFLERLKSL